MTKHPRHGFLAVIAALVLALPLLSFAHPRQMEALNRGLVVSSLGKSGMLVSWRLLGTEDPNTEFNLYREFNNYLDSKAREKGIPLQGQFELTPLCNFNCKMCYVHLNPEQMNGQSVLSVDTCLLFDVRLLSLSL